MNKSRRKENIGDILLLRNEIKGWQITGEKDPDQILKKLRVFYRFHHRVLPVEKGLEIPTRDEVEAI